MRRANRKKHSRCVSTSPKRSPAAYTPKQRAQLRHGLRILARMIVRAHLRRQASLAISTSPETPPEGEAGG